MPDDVPIVKTAGGTVVGGLGGRAAGMAAGAALGSVVPVIGTAIGGMVGGAIGGMAGAKTGDSITDKVHAENEESREKNRLQTEAAQESANSAKESAEIATGEPMNLAWRLLKEDDLPDMSKFGLPVQRPTSITYADGVKKPIPYEYRGPKYEYRSPTDEREIRAEAEKQRRARLHEERMGEKRERFFERWVDGNYQSPEVSPTMNEVSPTMYEVENQPTWPTSTPYNEKTGFTLSEPMEIAMQLLKERVSPEAIAHKLAYDKKYESTPERVKYREELNRERRRRHIMGQGGPDMSHTKDHTIVPEDPHTNRARHFKDKGTLL